VRGDPLTKREDEICRHLADGYTQGQIAARLCIAPGTVGVLLMRARQKVGAQTNIRLAVLYDRVHKR
jgi:DNA-binding CsgD family transcriptional regulator